MNNRERMLKGLLYDGNNDMEMLNERNQCKKLCREYNNIDPTDTEKKMTVMRKILGKTKEKFLIEQPFLCDYGSNIEIGENFYANHYLTILDPGKVKFGDNVFIGPNCSFYTPEHPLDAETRNKGFEYAFPITVGDNVWIGGNVTVLGGVSIGNNSVIGAGSVVTKDIPDNVIAVGNPCRVLKEIPADKEK